MSSNLLKRGLTCSQEEKRVIYADDLARKKIEEIAARVQTAENEGFLAGLQAAEIEVSEEAGEAKEQSSNVIKANAGEEAADILEQAKREAEKLLNQAREEALTLKQEAAGQAEQEKQLVLEQAREKGYEEGLSRVENMKKQLEQEFSEKERLLEEEYHRSFEELEPCLVDAITGIYEHIFKVELGGYRELLFGLISSTMRHIEGSRSFFVHVSKEDYEAVNAAKEQIVAEASAGNIIVEIIGDMTLAPNDCFIETDCGIFDCGLGTQLEELSRKLKLLSYEKQQ